LCCCGGGWGVLAFLIMGEYLAVFVPLMHIFEYRYFMVLLPFWCLFFVVSFYKMYDWLSFSKCNLLVKRFLSLGIVFCILSYMSFGANSLFLFRKSDNDIKFNEEVKGKNVVVMLPYSWMFHEILWYLKDAKNVYTMLSTDVNEVKEEELFGKDTLVLIMNHDSRDDLKLRSRNVSPYIKNEDGLEFLYIVQFSERFYDVYKVK